MNDNWFDIGQSAVFENIAQRTGYSIGVIDVIYREFDTHDLIDYDIAKEVFREWSGEYDE